MASTPSIWYDDFRRFQRHPSSFPLPPFDATCSTFREFACVCSCFWCCRLPRPHGLATIASFRKAAPATRELKYINDLPVLIVAGTPEEIGRQKAVLTGRGDEDNRRLSAAIARALEPQGPLAEVPGNEQGPRARRFRPIIARSCGRSPSSSGIDRDMGLLGNTLADIYRGSFACSSLIVAAEHSATSGPLFGRNLDFYTLGILDKYSLVTVHRPEGEARLRRRSVFRACSAVCRA